MMSRTRAFSAILVTALMGAGTAASATTCKGQEVTKIVSDFSDRVNNGYGTNFSQDLFHGVLAPNRSMEIQVSIEEFTVENKSSSGTLVFSLYGHNMIGASFWIAQIDPKTCKVVRAGEVLGEGGGGL